MSYFNFNIFTFFLNFIFIFANFIPDSRWGHTSVLVDKKLYISGGLSLTNWKEFFYLDVSQHFAITALQWNDLTFTGPTLDVGSSIKQQWANVTNVGNQPTGRSQISCAKFGNGSIAIFAGYFNYVNDSKNDLWIFDSLALTWSLKNASNAPPDIWAYRAITLPDDAILYIGVPFMLPLYDSTTNTWKNLNTTGPTPPSRHYFSAVLTSDKRIKIFGGSSDNSSILGDL
ncbi:galactose oxidase [Gigaspora margarita]|uniref:Galactose oxidase n=1 Tax=Gigaspora margarita TaxID=4874 RepID=A0A8H4AH22_GIGMA|nr:galactose oxidase [Gigaspora margarita]